MVIAAVIFVCFLLMIVFIGVTVAGGKAHDRANEESAREAQKLEPTSEENGADHG